MNDMHLAFDAKVMSKGQITILKTLSIYTYSV